MKKKQKKHKKNKKKHTKNTGLVFFLKTRVFSNPGSGGGDGDAGAAQPTRPGGDASLRAQVCQAEGGGLGPGARHPGE